MSKTTIDPGEAKVIISGSESPIDTRIEVTGNRVFLGSNSNGARRENFEVPAGDRGPLSTVDDGDAVYAFVPNGESTATVTRAAVGEQGGYCYTPEPRSDVDVNVESDTYTTGNGFDFDGTAYPYTIDPVADMEVLHITEADDILAQVTTTGGASWSIPLSGGTGVIDWLTLDSVTFDDPKGTGGALTGSWAGR